MQGVQNLELVCINCRYTQSLWKAFTVLQELQIASRPKAKQSQGTLGTSEKLNVNTISFMKVWGEF